MNKNIKLILILVSSLVLLGCTKENKVMNGITINNENIRIGDVFDAKKYSNYVNYSEVSSCAFEGLDKTYTYNDYEITTFPDGEVDKVYSILFLNENISTNEGIKLGESFEKVIETYGQEYEKIEKMISYQVNNATLEFIVEDNVIISIEYIYNL